MARKKTTTARKRASRTTETEKQAAGQTAELPGGSVEAPVEAPKPARKTTRRTSTRRAKPAQAEAPAEAPASSAPAARAEAAPTPQVERTDDAVVVRLPPAGRVGRFTPAAARAQPASTPATPAQPPAAVQPSRDRPPAAPSQRGHAAARDERPHGAARPAADTRAERDSGRRQTNERAPQHAEPPGDRADRSQEAPARGEEGESRRRGRRRRGRGRRREWREEEGAAPRTDSRGGRGAGEASETVWASEEALETSDELEPRAEAAPDWLGEGEIEDVEVADAPETLESTENGDAEAVAAVEPAEAEPRGRRRRRRRRRGRGRNRESEYAGTVAGDSDAEPISDLEPIVRDETERGEAEAEEAVGEEEEAQVEAPSGGPKREMIINYQQREECRIGILADGRLEEFYIERASAENHVGNIYKGIVTNVEASIQAAFIDFGLGKNGFLHISDLHPQYFPSNDRQAAEDVGRKLPRKHRPPIQRCLRRGQEVIVQITKEGIGTKGPTLTTYISIPGRYLVMMPGMRRLGVSRKIEEHENRDQLRKVLGELDLPDDIGFIARTAAHNRTRRELQADLNYLTRLWRTVERRNKSERAPAELYRESDLVIRTIRDVFAADISRIVIDDPEVAERAREFLSIFSPRSSDILQLHTDPEPVFHRYGIEAELERLHSRVVPLRIGGSLVIDQTEAIVAIDVNSGKFRSEDDAETTAYKINLEAADEIPRQLRLRDLGGLVICDFIDMRMESHRREIERRLVRNLKQHKERAKVLRMSAFGIIEMTRQRQRGGLTRSLFGDCRYCHGTGLIKMPESVVIDVMRVLQLAATREHVQTIEVTCCPDVAGVLLNRKRSAIHELETAHRRTIMIRADASFGPDQVQVQCTDHRGRLVPYN